MNKEQILAIIQGGHLTDGDLADALLAELAKVQDPFGYYENGRWSIVTDGGPDKWRARKEYTGPLYTHPAPSVPEGYQLVPIEPTDAMQKAGGHVNSEWLNDSAPIGENRYGFPMPGVWKAMLAAARSE